MTALATACMLVGGVTSFDGAVGYIIVLGVALGSFRAINAAVYAHHFGRRHAGEIRGLTFVSYFPVLVAGATLCVLAALANLIVTPPRGT
jgi:hypothetical protein